MAKRETLSQKSKYTFENQSRRKKVKTNFEFKPSFPTFATPNNYLEKRIGSSAG